MPQTQLALHYKRTLNAPASKVFDAWTKPEIMKQWYAPSDAFEVPVAEVDLTEGGQYRIVMKAPDGNEHAAVGTFQEIIPNKKLVFTWQWEAPNSHESLVTLEFKDLEDGKTEFTMTHQNFMDEADKNMHDDGWKGCLARLEKMFA